MTNETTLDISGSACNAAQRFLQRWDADTVRLARIIDEVREEARAEERERCAKIADVIAVNHDFYDGPYDVGRKIAAAIRAAGEGSEDAE